MKTALVYEDSSCLSRQLLFVPKSEDDAAQAVRELDQLRDADRRRRAALLPTPSLPY